MMKNRIEIIDQGQGWVCVHKPGGISVHNQPGKDLVSLVPGLMGNGFKGTRLQPVHRLDKDTSGLLLLAIPPAPLARLSDLFARGKVKKKYKALVHGNFDLPDQAEGTWETPLSKQAGGRTDPRGKGRKVNAKTRYRVLDQSVHYALLEIELLTGRKHQIRRHAKLAGHPVVGDSRYGSPRSIALLREQKKFQAMALHSCFLQFTDLGKPVTIELPGLPGDMDRLLKEDR